MKEVKTTYKREDVFMKRGKVARFMGLAVATMLTLAAVPVSASAVEVPFILDYPGKMEELTTQEDYTANIDGEITPSFLKGNILRIKENSTITISKESYFDGSIECYGYIYYLNDDNVIVESTGQVMDAIVTDTPKVIELSDKDFGYGFAGNLKGVVYQLSFNCVPNDGSKTENYWIAYKVYSDGAKASKIASNTQLTVNVNNEKVLFEAFNIDNNNYVSLRDFAMAVNGTKKQFEVGYDSDKNAITLTSKKAYTATGNELPIDKEYKRQEEESRKRYEQSGIRSDMGTSLIKNITTNAVETTSKIYLDGQEVSLTAYNINGSNYFQLRSIAKLFDIGVTYDNATSTVGIDTSVGYTE